MTPRTELDSYLSTLLELGKFRDYGPNGLQVEGKPEVQKLVSGVTASRAFIEAAIEHKADAVLVHHGLFWKGHDGRLTGWLKARVELLLAHGINLFAYHLPLDAHPEVGNNALICAALGLERAEPFAEHKGRAIGVVGRSAEGIPFEQLRARCASVFEQEPFVFETGPDPVHSVAIISGSDPPENGGRPAISAYTVAPRPYRSDRPSPSDAPRVRSGDM